MKLHSIRNACRLAALLLLPVAAAQADTISVDANGGAGVVAVAADSQCSLREAMLLGNGAAANGECVADTDGSSTLSIQLPAGATFTLLDGPYAGTGFDEAGPTGLPLVSAAYAIVGNGALIQRDAATGTPKFRLLQVVPGGTLEISNLSLEHGWAAGHPFDGYNMGGCLLSRGSVHLTDVDVRHCIAEDDNGYGGNGGGIYNGGTLVMDGGSISDNRTRIADASGGAGLGGGLFNIDTATLTGVTVSGNRVGGASGGGGGISNGSTLTVVGCTFIGNDANWNGSTEDDTHRGGAIRNSGTLTVIGSVFRDNHAWIGGGIATFGANAVTTVVGSTLQGNEGGDIGGALSIRDGSLLVAHSTLTGNAAGFTGGGMFVNNNSTAVSVDLSYVTIGDNTASGIVGWKLGAVTLDHSIVTSGCYSFDHAFPVSAGYNLASDTSCGLTAASDRQDIDPQLAALADNGGGTRTLRPLPGSPVIDAVPAADCALNVPTGVDASIDQRGVARPQGQGCDIGAVEVAPYVANFVAYGGGGQHALAGDPFAWPLVVQARDAQGYGIEGLQLTIDVPTSGASASCSPSVTDATGVLLTYCIANQQVGSYQVSIAVPAGRSATSPAPSYSFTLANDLNDRIFGDGFDGSPLATVVMVAGQGSVNATFSVPPGLLANRIVPILVVRDAQGHRVALVEARRDRDGTRIRVIEYDARGYPLRVGAWNAPAATRLQLHVERQVWGVTTALQAEAK